MIRILLAATALSAVPLAAAPAQTYGAHSAYAPNASYDSCVRQQRNRQVAGAVIGGVLGAVIGAEIHDDRQDRDRARHYRGGRDYGYRGRHYRGRDYRRGRGHHRRHRGYHEDGNDGAVLAGAGLGALAGAAIAGSGGADGCARHGRGYQEPYRQHSQYGYAQPQSAPAGYAEPYRDPYADPYAGSSQSYEPGYGGDAGSSGEVLLGGQDYGRQTPTRTYSAGASASFASSSTGVCRDMRSGNGALTWMCRGDDGVWRPAEVYSR